MEGVGEEVSTENSRLDLAVEMVLSSSNVYTKEYQTLAFSLLYDLGFVLILRLAGPEAVEKDAEQGELKRGE